MEHWQIAELIAQVEANGMRRQSGEQFSEPNECLMKWRVFLIICEDENSSTKLKSERKLKGYSKEFY